MAITQVDQEIIDKAWIERNPSIFLEWFIKPKQGGYNVFPGSVRHQAYMQKWIEQGKPDTFTAKTGGIAFEVEHRIDTKTQEMIFFEKRGFILLPWQLDFWRSPQEEKTIIGLTGVGKTFSIGAMAMFMCATIPGFRFLNVGPTIYQSNLMVREINSNLEGSGGFTDKFLRPRRPYIQKPYATYYFDNGSTAEFMNVQKNAANIQSWSGDWINIDEAGLLNMADKEGQTMLSSIMIGLATRMRAQRPDGNPRLGWLSMISMAYDNDTLWERYERAEKEEHKQYYYSNLVLHKDNPYLTPRDLGRIIRNIPAGQEEQWLRGARPRKTGGEFSNFMIDQTFSAGQWEEANQPESNIHIERNNRGDVIGYQENPRKDHVYLMAGDPGTGEPPLRNAPAIMVWDVTDFPRSRSRLVNLWWGYGNGSIMPFINKFDELASIYHVPENFRGYDSTSSQKFIAELAWGTGERIVLPLGFDGAKKWVYLNSAKILMSKGQLMVPEGIKGLRTQLRDYILPDKKLAQDLVATLCMSCELMFPLYRDVYPEGYENDNQTRGILRSTQDGTVAEEFSRYDRSVASRYGRSGAR